MNEEVFMSQPEEFLNEKYPNNICKLTKPLYGIKQAPRAWYDKLRTTLLTWGFVHTENDNYLFFFKTKTLVLTILDYVDETLVTGNDQEFKRPR